MGMIHTIRGILTEKATSGLIIECAGLGFGVVVPLSTYDHLPAVGSEVMLRTVHIVRDDDQLLFGFLTERECKFFKTLLSVSGIGPKIALAVLSGLTPGELATAILDGDTRRLSSIPGIGKKTAERVILELGDKINPLEAMAVKSGERAEREAPPAVHDAMLSLVALGNKPETARQLVQAAFEANPGASVQDLIRLALKS